MGSLSRADTFIEEAVGWIKSLERGTASLDIFSYHQDPETHFWLHSVADDRIRFHEQGVPYGELPDLLRNFHFGLILYKGNTLNYVHNASNKLFEYLACGLDVLYPKQMLGVKPFAASNSRPRVLECDFEHMGDASDLFLGRQNLPRNKNRFDCATEFGRLEETMLEVLK